MAWLDFCNYVFSTQSRYERLISDLLRHFNRFDISRLSYDWFIGYRPSLSNCFPPYMRHLLNVLLTGIYILARMMYIHLSFVSFERPKCYNFITSTMFLVNFNGIFNLCTLCMTIIINNNKNNNIVAMLTSAIALCAKLPASAFESCCPLFHSIHSAVVDANIIVFRYSCLQQLTADNFQKSSWNNCRIHSDFVFPVILLLLLFYFFLPLVLNSQGTEKLCKFNLMAWLAQESRIGNYYYYYYYYYYSKLILRHYFPNYIYRFKYVFVTRLQFWRSQRYRQASRAIWLNWSQLTHQQGNLDPVHVGLISYMFQTSEPLSKAELFEPLLQ